MSAALLRGAKRRPKASDLNRLPHRLYKTSCRVEKNNDICGIPKPVLEETILPMPVHSDQRYIEALCQGDEALLRELYAKHSRELLHWVLKNNGTAEDAQDLFQDGLMAIYDRYCGRDFQLTSAFGALLMAICRRKWFDRLAQKKREEGVRNLETARYMEEASEWEAAEEAILQQKRQECLAEVFELLSEQCRQLLSLVTKGEASVELIAQELGLPGANAVYQSKHRCTARWRQLFFEHFQAADHG
jgi:RNA polymerase sigma factor (sigma-70 family)